MITPTELQELLQSTETYRVENIISMSFFESFAQVYRTIK